MGGKMSYFIKRTMLSSAAAVAIVCVVSAATIAIPSAQAATSKSSVVGVLDGPFGPMLVAGSGPSTGTALYFITSDHGNTFGCTTTKQNVGGQPYVCTGPSTSQHADWPAYTTTGAPVAGPGVKQSMLGEVDRKGVGEQVTYNGHPLYLFDAIPGSPSGESWDEPSLPADHGMWWLLSPGGVPVGSEGTLSTVTIKGNAYLGAQVIDGAGGVLTVPVYSYSGGTACTNQCTAAFPPLYAQGSPGLVTGLSGATGVVTRSDGSQQRTWNGKALYVFGDEGVAIGKSGLTVAGNGNGVEESGGTFTLIPASSSK
jgi:predicted lipoprotein with Yx(FWY)xxD motif